MKVNQYIISGQNTSDWNKKKTEKHTNIKLFCEFILSYLPHINHIHKLYSTNNISYSFKI